jgi:hypothetical protein
LDVRVTFLSLGWGEAPQNRFHVFIQERRFLQILLARLTTYSKLEPNSENAKNPKKHEGLAERDSSARFSASVFFLKSSRTLIHIQIFFQICFLKFVELFELMFDSPLHDAAGSQISPMHYAAGSQIFLLYDAASGE